MLFVMFDDLGNVFDSPASLRVSTPHLDRLRQRGIYFQEAYCQVPLCNPSRASILTGLRPDHTTVWDLDRHFRQQLPQVVTLPQYFRQQGYRVARVGKLYHYDVPTGIGTHGLDDAVSWDEVVNPRGRDVWDEAYIENPTPTRPISAALSWLAAEGDDEQQTDGMIATAAIDFLEKHRRQPFFLGVGFFRPHTPYVAPRKYFELYPRTSLHLPLIPADDRQDLPAAAIPHNIPLPNYGLPSDKLLQAMQAYAASVTFADAQLGRILAKLDEWQLTDDTLIVVLSDHGYHLGEHGLWQKRTLFRESARTPLFIAAPWLHSGGAVCQRTVELIDLYPTLTEIVFDHAVPAQDGQSLQPLLVDPSREWDSIAMTQILRPGSEQMVMGRALTSERWRYIEWNEGQHGRELYDRQQDPQEWHNLAEQTRYNGLMRELARQFQGKAQGQPPTSPVQRTRL